MKRTFPVFSDALATLKDWAIKLNNPEAEQGDIFYGSNQSISRLAKSTIETRYLANTGENNNPKWDQVNLENGVTGTLPFANLPTLSKVVQYSNESAAVNTTSGTMATLSSASVSLAVVAKEAVVIEATCSMGASDSTTIGEFRLVENGTKIGSVVQGISPIVNTSGNVRSVTLKTILTSPTIGTNTYDLQWRRASGAGTLYGRFPQIIAYTLKVS